MTDQSGTVRAALRRLSEPVMIADSTAWLLWNVRAARVDPPRGAGDSIVTYVVFEASPAIVPRPQAVASMSLPPPLVRLSSTGTRVPFDCWVEFADIATELATVSAGGAEGEAGTLRLIHARLKGGGDRLAIALDLDGR